jgi:hypothetical protein
MSRPRGAPHSAALLALAAVAAIAACNTPFALPPAALPPYVFSITLYAITATPIEEPSAYDLVTPAAVRTDSTSNVDFAFDIQVDSLGDTVAVLLPRGALGLYRDGGLQITQTPWDSIHYAPNGGYNQGDPLTVSVGSVVLAASRAQTCNIGYVFPLYAKMAVTALDLTARSITLHMLIDSNCGYRSLDSTSVPPSK